jgi:phytol kinase
MSCGSRCDVWDLRSTRSSLHDHVPVWSRHGAEVWASNSDVEIRVVPLLATAAAQAGLLVAVEVGFRRGVGPETTRRIAHAVGAVSVAPLPLFLRIPELVVLAGLFTGVLFVTHQRRMLRSIHAIDRASVGALIFPAGLLLAILVGWHHVGAIAYAALVLGLADPAAALVGARVKSIGWAVPGGHKTVVGSVAFGIVAVAVGVLIGALSGGPHVSGAIAAATVLTAIEGSLGYGLDNLAVPAVASVLGIIWLGL